MRNESVDVVSEYCRNSFFKSEDSDKLLVFLPSVNGKTNYPYYPRISWGEELSKNYNVLYISDPYQPLSQYKESMGSWFISPDGESTIPILSKKIEILKENIAARDVIFYGSSMGGYAAIMLSTLAKDSKAIAECPQIYLNNHPGSRFVCENILKKDVAVEEIEPLAFLKRGQQKHVHLVCSAFDRHYSGHLLPFVEDIKDFSDGLKSKFTIGTYIDLTYNKGHVALKKEDAIKVITSMTDVLN